MSTRLLQALALLTMPSMLHAAEAGLRPVHPHGKHGKPTAATRMQVERAHRVFTLRWEVALLDAARDGRHIQRVQARSTEFSWDALNVTTIMCGVEKCYFPSQREGEGWLVGKQHGTHPRSWFPQWGNAWRFAEELRVGFGVKHLLEGPPLLATLSPEQATYLNAKIIALNRHHLLKHGPKWRHFQVKNIKKYYLAGYHAVQKVRSCSWPECMLLKCKPQYLAKYVAIDRFVAKAPNKTKLSQGIGQSFAVVAAMVKAHPCLRIDFQVYLRNDGAVLNIDLDRCFDSSIEKSTLNISTSHLAQLPALCKTGNDQTIFDSAISNISAGSAMVPHEWYNSVKMFA